jgi:hypothetical protein
MSFLLSLLPRPWLQAALLEQWKRTLTRGERARLEAFGATGNGNHHPYAWAE